MQTTAASMSSRTLLSALVAGSLAWTAILATPGALAQDTAKPATPPAAPASAKPRIHEILAQSDADVQAFNDHVTILSNPWMEGRLPGTRGMEYAMNYMEDQFKKAGLEHKDKSLYEPHLWQKYDVEQAITVWKANGTASGVAHFTENPQPGVQKYGPQPAVMFNLDHPVTPVQRQYHDQTSPLAASPQAWSSPVGQMSAQTGGQLTSHKLSAQQGTKTLRKLSEGRHKFARLSREDQARMRINRPQPAK
jgi:hypothetical protein